MTKTAQAIGELPPDRAPMPDQGQSLLETFHIDSTRFATRWVDKMGLRPREAYGSAMTALFLIAMISGVVLPACGVVAFFALLQCGHVILHHQPGESVLLPFVILGGALTPFWLLLMKIKHTPKRPLPPGYIRAWDSNSWTVIVRADSIRDDLYDRRFQHAERDDGAPISIYKQR